MYVHSFSLFKVLSTLNGQHFHKRLGLGSEETFHSSSDIQAERGTKEKSMWEVRECSTFHGMRDRGKGERELTVTEHQ